MKTLKLSDEMKFLILAFAGKEIHAPDSTGCSPATFEALRSRGLAEFVGGRQYRLTKQGQEQLNELQSQKQ